MKIIKIKINEKEEELEKIVAIIFKDKEGNNIISVEDLSYLTDISVTSLKTYIHKENILHYHIASKWFVNIDEFWKNNKILE